MIRKLANDNMENVAGGDVWEIATRNGKRYYVEIANKNRADEAGNDVLKANGRIYVGKSRINGQPDWASPTLYADLAEAVRVDRVYNGTTKASVDVTNFLPVVIEYDDNTEQDAE